MSVERIMTKKVISIDKNRKLSDAVNLMEKKRISRVAVTSDGNLCGILTEKDLADHIGSSRHGQSSPSSLHISTAMNSPVISIEKDVSIRSAAKMMLEKGISSLPVLNENGLTGIVTKTDMVGTMDKSEEKLENIMKRGAITVSENDRIVHARRLMLDNKIRRVVVVDEGKIIGILTERGTAKAIFEFKQTSEGGHSTRIRKLLVKDAMTPRVITLDVTALVKDALKVMTENKFSGIPLTMKGKLVGMVTKTDILKIVK